MSRHGAGWRLERSEDSALLRGAGSFIADLTRSGLLHVAFLRAPLAHARVLRLDLSAARGRPGVVAVVGAAELIAAGIGAIPGSAQFKTPAGEPAVLTARPLLAGDVVRHVGEAVAAVVAESTAAAEDALDAIAVDYDPLPAVVDVADPRAEIVAAAQVGDGEATAAAFARAAHVTRLTLRNQRLMPLAMEPRGILAEPGAAGRLTLHLPSQNPTAVKHQLAALLGRAPESIRVLVPMIGGSFGMKSFLYAEEALVAWLAVTLGRPLRWIATRSEEMLSGTHARDQVTEAAMAFDADGRILALRSRSLCNLGAYPNAAGPHVALILGPKVATGAYDIPAAHVETLGLLTHTQATAPYRGAGRPEAIYVVERLLETAALELGRDPLDLRRLNLIRADAMPYRTALGETYERTDLAALLDRALQASDSSGFPARRAASEARGQLRGRGMALFVEWTGGSAARAQSETVRLRVDPAGRVVVQSAVLPMGQGIVTSLRQVCAAAFDLPAEMVTIETGDTDQLEGYGSFASRSISVGGSAVAITSAHVLERLSAEAATLLEADLADVTYAAGQFRIVGTDRAMSLFAVAARVPQAAELLETSGVAGPTWPAGAYVCEVEVDPETGQVTVSAFTAVDDLGVVVSPAIVEGQVQGALAQGLGQALWEGVTFDGDGQLLSGSLMDYAAPRAKDLPLLHGACDQRWPSGNNALGCKGAGESGTVGATPAAVSAVLDALRPFAVRDLAMPLTPERVWRAIREGRSSSG